MIINCAIIFLAPLLIKIVHSRYYFVNVTEIDRPPSNAKSQGKYRSML